MFWTIVIIVVVIWFLIDSNSGSSNSIKSQRGEHSHSQLRNEKPIEGNTPDLNQKRMERKARLKRLEQELQISVQEPSSRQPTKDVRVTESSSVPKKDPKETVSQAASVKQKQLTLKKKFPAMKELEDWGVVCLWHMTHVRNVPSIMKSGLLSHRSTKEAQLEFSDISDPEVQQWRTKKDPFYNKSLHDYVPFYINPRNPMLYRRKEIQHEICFLEISLEALGGKDFLLSDGNAASLKTEFFDGCWGLQFLPWDVLRAPFWTDFDDGKRKACSEILLLDRVDPKWIKSVHCFSHAQAQGLARKGINATTSIEKYFR